MNIIAQKNREQTKICPDCSVEKPLTEFGYRVDGRQRKYLKTYCKSCYTKRTKEWYKLNRAKANQYGREWRKKNPESDACQRRNWQLMAKYGITFEEKQQLLLKQGGVCIICNSPMELPSRHCVVDHDHTTGKIRALLCTNCNTGIGQFKESVEILERAIAYINEHTGLNGASVVE